MAAHSWLMDTQTVFAGIVLAGLVLFLWGSLGAAASIILNALADLVSPAPEPTLPAAAKDAEPSEAEEKAWAERWAARAGRWG